MNRPAVKLTKRLLAAAASATLVGGCVRVPPPDADLAERHVAYPDRFAAEVAAEGQALDADVTDGWLGEFDGSPLPALVEEAWAHNPDLYVAAARFEEAAANLRVAASLLYPQLSGLASARRVDDGIVDADEVFAVGLQVSWEVDLWGRIRAARSAAGNVAVATGYDLMQARHSIAAATAQSYFAVLAADTQLQIDQELLEASRFTAEVTRQRVQAGLGTSLDENLAESNVSLAEAAVRDDLAAIESARRALELLLGRYPAAELEAASATLPGLPEGAVSVGVPTTLLERRPDVRAAARLVDAAYYGVESAKRARLPSLTLTANVGSAIDPDDIISEIAATVLAPIFYGGALQSQQAAATAQQRQAIGQFAGVALQAFSEVEESLANERYLAQREQQLAQASERLRQASATAEARYGQGLLPILDLQQVRSQDFQTRSLLLSVRFEQLRQRLNLYLALGGDVFPASDDQVAEPADALLDRQFPDPDIAPLSGELSVGQLPTTRASTRETTRASTRETTR